MLHDYESLAFRGLQRPTPAILETYSGQDIVEWYGRIERQLIAYTQEYDHLKQDEDATKVRIFLKTWRDNELTGSINIDTIKALLAATEQLAVENWRLSNYFSQLRDRLRQLKASVEELPTEPYSQPRSRPRRLSSRGTASAPEAPTDEPPQPLEAPAPEGEPTETPPPSR